MGDRLNLEVFVRLDNERTEGVRELSFKIPDDVPQAELLNRGVAIDGNTAVIGVASYRDPQHGHVVPLAAALNMIQSDLMKWFGEKGYDVVFK